MDLKSTIKSQRTSIHIYFRNSESQMRRGEGRGRESANETDWVNVNFVEFFSLVSQIIFSQSVRFSSLLFVRFVFVCRCWRFHYKLIYFAMWWKSSLELISVLVSLKWFYRCDYVILNGGECVHVMWDDWIHLCGFWL